MTSRLDGSLAGVRIGVPTEFFFDAPGMEPEVKAGVLGAIKSMEEAGATVVEVKIPHAEEASPGRITAASAEYGDDRPTDLLLQARRAVEQIAD